MIPNGSTPARRAARQECQMHDLMFDLVAGGRIRDAERCRTRLAVQSAIRHSLASVEHREARERATRQP